MMLLHIVRWLRTHTNQECGVLLARGGPLEPDFAELCPTYTADDFTGAPERLQQFGLIYSNTLCNGLLLERLPYGDVPIITHVHELDFGIDVLGAQNMASVIRQTSHFIVCARILGDRLHQRFRIPRERISVHYECIPYEAVVGRASAVSPAELRDRYHIPDDAFVLTACGTLDIRKAPDLFVQLAAYVRRESRGTRPVRFLWIGKVNDQVFYQALQHDLRRLGLQDDLTFVGELESPHSLLALADVFCLTSREDPFPLVMLESAALGKPVLCFEGAGGGAEFCAEGGGLAVPFLDVAAMADVCVSLMRDDERRLAQGQRAADAVRTKFNTEVAIPRLWQELEPLAIAPPEVSEYRQRASTLTDIFAEWHPDDAPDRAMVRMQVGLREPLREVRRLLESGQYAATAGTIVRELHALVTTETPEIALASLGIIGDALAAPDHDSSSLPSRRLFDDASYLTLNPDLQPGIDSGFFASGWDHFQLRGFEEGRQWLSRDRAALETALACVQEGNVTDAEQLLTSALSAGCDDEEPAPLPPVDPQPHPEPSHAHLLIPDLPGARRAGGKAGEAAMWDVTLDGESARAIFMHPPAELSFTLPTRARGRFATAVAIHPDVWDQPTGGGCEFHVRVDGRVALVVDLDPAHRPSERHWHHLELEIPETTDGNHEVVLETRSVGHSRAYRWALWREPTFTADGDPLIQAQP